MSTVQAILVINKRFAISRFLSFRASQAIKPPMTPKKNGRNHQNGDGVFGTNA
jgi:hypothetical protein